MQYCSLVSTVSTFYLSLTLSGVQAFDGRKGYMYKMGGRHKTWKLRYFVLMPGQFSYYKNDPVSLSSVLPLYSIFTNYPPVYLLPSLWLQKGKCLGEVKLKNMRIILPRAGALLLANLSRFVIFAPN